MLHRIAILYQNLEDHRISHFVVDRSWWRPEHCRSRAKPMTFHIYIGADASFLALKRCESDAFGTK